MLAASFLSMTESKRGHATEARKWLDQAEQWLATWDIQGWRRMRIELAIAEANSALARVQQVDE